MPQKKRNITPPRGPSQEERRRRAANRPLGGNATARPPGEDSNKSYRSSATRLQRITAIVTIIMLIAIVLSLIPSCFVSTGTAASIERQDLPENRLSYGSARNLHREAAELPPTASLARPTEPLSQNKFYVGDTGHFINGAFLDFWHKQGETTVLGNPLSEKFVQNGRTVQLFEKALLESHPEETDTAKQVQLGFLGRQLADARGLHFFPATNTTTSPTQTYFNETGQTISGNFKAYWEKNNGLTLLGLPIGPELQDAGTTVQYFERGVLQLKTNSNTTVEMAESGDNLLAALGWPRPTSLSLELNIGENEIYQGRTLGMRLTPDFSWQPQNLKGNVGDEALKLLQVGTVYKSLKSFAPWADVKAYPLNLFYTDAGGRDRELDRSINVVKFDFPLQNLYLPDDKTALTDKANDDYDNAQLAQAYATYTPKIMWNGVWNWPAFGPISTEFAALRAYGDSTDYDKYHGGLDISLPLGTPAAAPADGKVIYTGLLKARGNTVALDHGMGVTSYYFHLNTILVKPGDVLKKGQILGQVGTTGRSTGPHLHWEVRVNGIITYPLLFVNYDMSR